MGFNLERLTEIAKPRSAEAIEKQNWRNANRDWLRVSQEIALSLHHYLRTHKMTQKGLAEAMGVSPTYIGKLLKGQENLTLETICRLQSVIGQELITVSRPYESAEPMAITSLSLCPV